MDTFQGKEGIGKSQVPLGRKRGLVEEMRKNEYQTGKHSHARVLTACYISFHGTDLQSQGEKCVLVFSIDRCRVQ